MSWPELVCCDGSKTRRGAFTRRGPRKVITEEGALEQVVMGSSGIEVSMAKEAGVSVDGKRTIRGERGTGAGPRCFSAAL